MVQLGAQPRRRRHHQCSWPGDPANRSLRLTALGVDGGDTGVGFDDALEEDDVFRFDNHGSQDHSVLLELLEQRFEFGRR